MKNLTYDQLIELAPKDRPFQIEVESNPLGKGSKQLLWGYLYQDSTDTELDTCISNQQNIDGIIYSNRCLWKTHYKGTFTLIDPRYQKPEVLKVGQKVRIMESARECVAYEAWDDSCKDCVNTTDIINTVLDTQYGVSYRFNNGYTFPHYCVMPVEEEEIPERTLEDILSELSDTDKEIIISKLK
jgi:hypothetical protein